MIREQCRQLPYSFATKVASVGGRWSACNDKLVKAKRLLCHLVSLENNVNVSSMREVEQRVGTT